MSAWPSFLGLVVGSALIVGHGLLKRADYRFPWLVNFTGSLPRGLYEEVRCDLEDPTALIQFSPPADVQALYVARGYLTERTSLVKPLGGFPGDEACWGDSGLSINGRRVVDIPVADAMDRPLPHPSGCEVIANDRVLPLQTDHPRSLDGRYFGAIPRASILACVRPLWVAPPK